MAEDTHKAGEDQEKNNGYYIPLQYLRLHVSFDDRLCCNELDFNPHPGCFSDLFQGLEREALILAALDPRNRLLAGSHKLCQLLL